MAAVALLACKSLSNCVKNGEALPSLKQMIPNWIKPYALSVRRQYRRATWRYRALPDFIIIGAQKSGTSSIYYYLSQHPQLLPSFNKEVHFFDGGLDSSVDNFEKGKPWYCAHFPLNKNISADQKTFEASPLYIFNPLAPKRIFDLIPQVKIIALLRNPTERAISHYFHEKRFHREPLSIYEAFEKEEQRLGPVIKEKDYKSDIYMHQSYKSRGLYKDQLERYLKYFSMDQILVMSSEMFFTHPDHSLKRMFEFVGVDTDYKVKDLTPMNVARNRRDVAPEVYEYLNNFFLPHNQALYELVGEDYGW